MKPKASRRYDGLDADAHGCGWIEPVAHDEPGEEERIGSARTRPGHGATSSSDDDAPRRCRCCSSKLTVGCSALLVAASVAGAKAIHGSSGQSFDWHEIVVAVTNQEHLSPPPRLAFMQAAHETHDHYFLAQQEVTRRELQKILLACGTWRLTEQTSESLRAMRAARKQHLHAAFYLKSACARFVEETAHIPSDLVCGSVLLHHEPWNVAETMAVLNVTARIVAQPDEWCARDAAADLPLVELAMANHRNDSTFSNFESGTARLPSQAALVDAIKQQIDAPFECDLKASDFVESVRNDGLLLVGVVREFLSLHASCDWQSSLPPPPNRRAANFWSLFIGECNLEHDIVSADVLCEHPLRIYSDWMYLVLILNSIYHIHVPICGVPSLASKHLGASSWFLCGQHKEVDCTDVPVERRPWVCPSGNLSSFFAGYDWTHSSIPDGLIAYDVVPTNRSASWAHLKDLHTLMTRLNELRTSLLALMMPTDHRVLRSMTKGNVSFMRAWYEHRWTHTRESPHRELDRKKVWLPQSSCAQGGELQERMREALALLNQDAWKAWAPHFEVVCVAPPRKFIA